jgi:hypothetical protein
MKARNITCQPSSGRGTTSSLGIFTSVVVESSLDFYSLRRSPAEKLDLPQPDARSFLEVTSPVEREAIIFFPMVVEEVLVVEGRERRWSYARKMMESRAQGERWISAAQGENERSTVKSPLF